METHDAHYRKIELTGIEPIVEMERINCMDLPEEYHAIARRNLSRALAAKHRMRLGHKDDPAMEKAKAANYDYRAKHGTWRP